jgi:hypothetical protein
VSISKYFALAGKSSPDHIHFHPESAHVHSVRMDRDFYPAVSSAMRAGFTKPMKRDDFFKQAPTSCSCLFGGNRMTR